MLKLNYIAVFKQYKSFRREDGYLVRGELSGFPSGSWCKHFQILWSSIEELNKICPEPRLNQNEILIPILEGDLIPVAIDGLRRTVSRARNPYESSGDFSGTEQPNKAVV